MCPTKYTPEEYRALIQMSRHKHLLVEGKNDHYYFNVLLDNLVGRGWKDTHKIDIDKAEGLLRFDDPNVIGNREKVEEICHSVERLEIASKLAGFVDREFRGFEYREVILDTIKNHFNQNRLVWSRGHSVENYFFDPNILRDPFQQVTNPDTFIQAFELFQNKIDYAIFLACVFSHVGKEIGNIDRINSTIQWEIFSFDAVNINLWRSNLEQAFADQVERIVELYDKWSGIVQRTTSDVARWATHGHIGIRTLWCMYARCVYEKTPGAVVEKTRAARQVFRYEDELKFNICSNTWARQVIANHLPFPITIFSLLALPVPQNV